MSSPFVQPYTISFVEVAVSPLPGRYGVLCRTTCFSGTPCRNYHTWHNITHTGDVALLPGVSAAEGDVHWRLSTQWALTQHPGESQYLTHQGWIRGFVRQAPAS
jgi:hypothetical protein